MNRIIRLALAGTLALGACGERKEAQPHAMPGMGEMQGMEGMRMRSMELMPGMRARLDSLEATPGASAARMLAAHDAMTSEMLDAMGGEMRMMGMAADSGWLALTDSVRRDLASLPGLSQRALEVGLSAHTARMRRLLDLHEEMMRGMPTR